MTHAVNNEAKQCHGRKAQIGHPVSNEATLKNKIGSEAQEKGKAKST